MIKVTPDMTSTVAKRLTKLKSDITLSVLSGNYKDFKTAMKEHAKLAVDNFELSKAIKQPSISVPLFSKAGLRMAKVWVLNLFRIKTPEEKLLKKMCKQEQLKQQAQKYMKNV